MAAVLNEVGWKGNLEDFDRAAASAEITAVQIAPGTRIPFMSSRKNKKAHALVDVLWAGKKPIDAFAFEMSSNCERYRVVTPKACGNFWVEEPRPRQRRPEVQRPAAAAAAGRERERGERGLRLAARRVRDHRQQPAGRQQGHPPGQRQGARLRQAHERRVQVHVHRRPRAGYVRGEGRLRRRRGHDEGRGQALRADLRHHREPAPGARRQALHGRRVRLARRRRRPGRRQVGQGRGRGLEGRRRRARTTSPRRTT